MRNVRSRCAATSDCVAQVQRQLAGIDALQRELRRPRPGCLLLAAVALASGAASAAATQEVPSFDTADVARFYTVFDASDGAPSAAMLQQQYLDPGSPGLHDLAKIRGITADSLKSAIDKRPEIFRDARRCAAVLPQVSERVHQSLQSLRAQYPEALTPPVTVSIGRGTSGGTTGPTGVIVGLEAICAVVPRGDEVNRMVQLIAHEYGHVQQPVAQTEPDHPTLLLAAIVEGGAELVAELTSGNIANPQLKDWTRGRERQVETEFLQEKQTTDLERWVWNGRGTAERPGDLAYWVGYRINKALYVHAADKTQALRQILTMTDPQAILDASGWYPGIELPQTVTFAHSDDTTVTAQ